ncbi:MAG: neutral/alkaline non-lysosomal ceramidase N-terminal domain-containing protein [Chloroflexi bacterium]|nr:neutral/alkaline non-lysosomal ceramidase N-terminal domain-containing protein [Chloroflexota bacterium]
MSNRLLAGSAKVDITPPLTIPYLGYEPRHALFQGVHDPLYARAVALDDGKTQIILIAADSLGYNNAILGPTRNFTQEVRQRIQERTGVPAANIMLTASHAHSTPETTHARRLLDTPAAEPWLEVLIDQLASAAAMAFAQRKPSQLKAGAGAVEGLARNRRIIGKDGRIVGGPETTWLEAETTSGPVDTAVGVLYLETLEDQACTVLANFACHPVTVQVQPYVSADFPGAAMTLLEKSLPRCSNSLFLQGACGDINPIRNTTDFADVERYGLMLGGEVIKVVGQLSAPDYPTTTPTIQVQTETLLLKVRELPALEPAQQAYAEAVRQQANTLTDAERSHWVREQRMAEEKLLLIERGAAPIPAEVQVFRIGDVALVSLPGEPFAELGLTIKRHSPARHTFVIGYANGWIGYLPTPEAWQQGGYEVGEGPWTRVGPAGGPLLVETALKLLATLWA